MVKDMQPWIEAVKQNTANEETSTASPVRGLPIVSEMFPKEIVRIDEEVIRYSDGTVEER